MPIYEYQCDACGHQLEALQKISDPKLTTCPECGKETLRKRVSAAAFRLKGGGWYETDFKDQKSRKNVAGKDEAGTGDKDKDKKRDKEPAGGKSEKPADSKKSETSGKDKSAKTASG